MYKRQYLDSYRADLTFNGDKVTITNLVNLGEFQVTSTSPIEGTYDSAEMCIRDRFAGAHPLRRQGSRGLCGCAGPCAHHRQVVAQAIGSSLCG